MSWKNMVDAPRDATFIGLVHNEPRLVFTGRADALVWGQQ